jgi:RNA polymerase sigma-70 factor (ECF subfamily)
VSGLSASHALPSGWLAVLTAARAGSPDALGQLLEPFRRYLLAAAAAELDPDLQAKAGASDLVQESLYEGQRDFAGFRGQRPEELLAWLRQILLHNLANLRRHYRHAEMRQVGREVPLPNDVDPDFRLPDNSSTPSRHAVRAEERERLQAALARLPEHYRSVVEWRHRDGLPFADIATRLGRPPEAVRQLWWRALRRLKLELDSAP